MRFIPYLQRTRLAFALGMALVACRSGQQSFWSMAGFSAADLSNQVILLVPIAVTDDLGDDRTGIILDRGSREEATVLTCRSAPKVREDIRILCFNDPVVAPSSEALRSLCLQFARDVEIPLERWWEISRMTGAHYAVLFRPEDVSTVRKVMPRRPEQVDLAEKEFLNRRTSNGPVGVYPREAVTTRRTYQLSGELVDMHTGKVARRSVRSAADSTSTPDPPPASSHLHGIMRDLLSDLVD